MGKWFEELPKECPPKEALTPTGITVYRLSLSEIPSSQDFLSHRFIYPKKYFHGVSECVARSVSVYNCVEACKNLFKLPRHKKKRKLILKVTLKDSDGLIMKTFADPNHYSWWRSKSFNYETANIVQ